MSEMSSATIAAMYRRKNPYKPDIVLRLERQMQESIAREDYKEAARLRDEIRKLYPLDHLRTAMKRAVAAENYEEAARIRDEIVAWKIAHDPDMRPNTKRRTEGVEDEPPKDISADTTESRGEGGEKERGAGGASSTGGNAGNGGSATAEGTDVAKDTDDPDGVCGVSGTLHTALAPACPLAFPLKSLRLDKGWPLQRLRCHSPLTIRMSRGAVQLCNPTSACWMRAPACGRARPRRFAANPTSPDRCGNLGRTGLTAWRTRTPERRWRTAISACASRSTEPIRALAGHP
eukprot:ctg_2521.g446